MPYSQQNIPFQRGSHSSYTGALSAAVHRGRQTQRYLELLKTLGARTDHQAATLLHLPLSSVNSIRNGLGDVIVPSGFEEVHVGARKTKRQKWALAQSSDL